MAQRILCHIIYNLEENETYDLIPPNTSNVLFFIFSDVSKNEYYRPPVNFILSLSLPMKLSAPKHLNPHHHRTKEILRGYLRFLNVFNILSDFF